MENKNHPLVSVFVVTYNAEDYICETLDSIKAQTYYNIELIVSDDHSKDDTVLKANKWIEHNKERFVRADVITVSNNTGVSANYNRAVKACQGEWIKNVDGDDLLRPNCIEDNIEYISNHPEAEWVFSNVEIFGGRDSKVSYGYFFNEESKAFFEKEALDQLKDLLKHNSLPSQSSFIKADLLRQHPYNEAYRGLEDAPMWVYLTKSGVKAFYFDKCTAMYRKEESITKSNKRYFSSIYFESMQKFFWAEKIDYIKELQLQDAYNENRRFLYTMEFADVFLGNRRGVIKDLFFKIVRRIINHCTSFKL